MSAEVNFRPDGDWYVVRFDYDPELVALIKEIPAFARRWRPEDKSWLVHGDYTDRLADELVTGGCRVTGLESEPESRKQQRNGDMYCPSQCRQRAYLRHRRAAK